MTSIPSPFDALRSLLPFHGRAGDGGPFAGFGDGPEFDDGPRNQGPHGRRGNGQAADVSGPMRADGLPPLSVPDAAQVADLLSTAMRQNPSHPLFRELSQVPTEVFRQWVMDFLTMPPGLVRDVPGPAVESLAHAAATLLRDAGPPRSVAEARAEADALRATVQAQAQQATGRAQAAPRVGEDGRPITTTAAPMASAAPEGRMAADARAAALAQALALPARAEGLLPGAVQMAGLTASVAAPASAPQPVASPGAPGHAGASTEAARMQPDASVTWPPARVPVDPSLAARADRVAGAADPAPSGGLPGLVGAAGITLAAVGQPAGTTFAHAPLAAVRARKSQQARRAQRPDEAGQREGDGDGHPGEDRKERGNQPADSAQRQAAATKGAGEGRSASPAGAAAAAGHASMVGLLPRGYDEDADPDEEVSPAGHTVAGEDTDEAVAQSRRRQWLYWSLIGFTYGCLALALGMMTPLGASLPIAPESLPAWRNGLTTTGLGTGLWAWLLARRMR